MENKTTTTKTEYLSAFLDDEAGTFEQRRLLDELQKDEELLKKVASYSLIGEALRSEKHSVTVQNNFLAGIHEQLEQEPSYDKVLIKEAANQPTWLRPVGGMALAASLAVIAVLGIQMNNDAQQTATVIAQTTEYSQDAVAPVLLAKNTVTDAPVIINHDEAWRKRLKKYVDSHVRYASTSAIMPSVRAVGYASSY